jgi:predicted Rossmann fold flavoprotein
VAAIKPSSHITTGGITLTIEKDGRRQTADFERAILCAGGSAYPTLGARGELFGGLASLGHMVLPQRPALAPLLADAGALKALRGLRFDACAVLLADGRRLAETHGNLIFTDWGLNGPAVMDLSHHVQALPGAALTLALDFTAFFKPQYEALLARARSEGLPAHVLLNAFFPPKAGQVFLKAAGISADAALDKPDEQALRRLNATLTDSRLKVKGTRGFEFSQLSAGGVPVTEADPLTLASRTVPGLFLAGETLDVVGPCGGFNLQFAFSSGALAGLAAAQ